MRQARATVTHKGRHGRGLGSPKRNRAVGAVNWFRHGLADGRRRRPTPSAGKSGGQEGWGAHGRSALSVGPGEGVEFAATFFRRRPRAGLFKSPDFSDGRRIRRGVGRVRLAGGGCRSVLSRGCRACRGGLRGVLSACGRGGLPGVAHRGGGFLAGRGAQPDGGVGTASRASCGRAA